MISSENGWKWSMTALGLWASTLLWPSACVVTEPGTLLEWNLSLGASMPRTADVVVEQQRLQVEIDRALVSIVSLEIIPCGAEPSAWWKALSPLGIAMAHGGTTPTRMATPHVIDLLASSSLTWASANSRPPPGDYCWVRVTIGPADRDAVGMPADEDMTDSALLIRGSFGSGTTDRTPFTMSSTRTQSVDVPFLDANAEPTVLVVNDAQRNVAVDVWLDAPTALAGVDPTSAVEAQGGLHAITNLLASVHAVGCAQAPCVER